MDGRGRAISPSPVCLVASSVVRSLCHSSDEAYPLSPSLSSSLRSLLRPRASNRENGPRSSSVVLSLLRLLPSSVHPPPFSPPPLRIFTTSQGKLLLQHTTFTLLPDLSHLSVALVASISSKADPPSPLLSFFSLRSLPQTFQKEAIYRQMREYQRQHTRSSARVSELERRKQALEAGLEGVEVCWSEVSQRLPLQPALYLS